MKGCLFASTQTDNCKQNGYRNACCGTTLWTLSIIILLLTLFYIVFSYVCGYITKEKFTL